MPQSSEHLPNSPQSDHCPSRGHISRPRQLLRCTFSPTQAFPLFPKNLDYWKTKIDDRRVLCTWLWTVALSLPVFDAQPALCAAGGVPVPAAPAAVHRAVVAIAGGRVNVGTGTAVPVEAVSSSEKCKFMMQEDYLNSFAKVNEITWFLCRIRNL